MKNLIKSLFRPQSSSVRICASKSTSLTMSKFNVKTGILFLIVLFDLTSGLPYTDKKATEDVEFNRKSDVSEVKRFLTRLRRSPHKSDGFYGHPSGGYGYHDYSPPFIPPGHRHHGPPSRHPMWGGGYDNGYGYHQYGHDYHQHDSGHHHCGPHHHGPGDFSHEQPWNQNNNYNPSNGNTYPTKKPSVDSKVQTPESSQTPVTTTPYPQIDIRVGDRK